MTQRMKRITSPFRLMLLLTVAVFVADFLLVMLLWFWPTLTGLPRAFADAFVLIVVISPVLYFLFNRPIQREVEARLKAEQELRDRNRELDLFVENVAHSLRSALNTIIGAAWFLHNKYGTGLEGKDANLLSVIENDGRRLTAMIDDLLSLVRLKGREIPREDLDIEGIVRGVLERLDGEHDGGGSAVVIGALPRVFVSRSLLTVALDNLIRNAIWYGKKDGASVEIYGSREKGRISLFVRDHGAGVPEEERERIFDVLYRGKGSKHLPGTGIGLALVRKIAREYKGDVRVEETPGGGATFCLEFSDD